MNSESCEFIADEFIMLNINFDKCVTGNDLESDLFIFQHILRYRLVIMGFTREHNNSLIQPCAALRSVWIWLRKKNNVHEKKEK